MVVDVGASVEVRLVWVQVERVEVSVVESSSFRGNTVLQGF